MCVRATVLVVILHVFTLKLTMRRKSPSRQAAKPSDGGSARRGGLMQQAQKLFCGNDQDAEHTANPF